MTTTEEATPPGAKVLRAKGACAWCGGPRYMVDGGPPRCAASNCPGGYFEARPMVTPAHGAGPCRLEGDDVDDLQERADRFYAQRDAYRSAFPWARTGWQIVALLSAATLVLALAAIGLALPPRVMLAIGIAAGLAVALYGVWIMAGAIYDERKP